MGGASALSNFRAPKTGASWSAYGKRWLRSHTPRYSDSVVLGWGPMKSTFSTSTVLWPALWETVVQRILGSWFFLWEEAQILRFLRLPPHQPKQSSRLKPRPVQFLILGVGGRDHRLCRRQTDTPHCISCRWKWAVAVELRKVQKGIGCIQLSYIGVCFLQFYGIRDV